MLRFRSQAKDTFYPFKFVLVHAEVFLFLFFCFGWQNLGVRWVEEKERYNIKEKGKRKKEKVKNVIDNVMEKKWEVKWREDTKGYKRKGCEKKEDKWVWENQCCLAGVCQRWQLYFQVMLRWLGS